MYSLKSWNTTYCPVVFDLSLSVQGEGCLEIIPTFISTPQHLPVSISLLIMRCSTFPSSGSSKSQTKHAEILKQVIVRGATSEQYWLHSLILTVFTFVLGSKKLSFYLRYGVLLQYSFLCIFYVRLQYYTFPCNFLLFCGPTSSYSAHFGSPQKDGTFPDQLSEYGVLLVANLIPGKFRWDRSHRKRRERGWEVSSYWMTFRNESVLEIERASARSHCVENWLC